MYASMCELMGEKKVLWLLTPMILGLYIMVHPMKIYAIVRYELKLWLQCSVVCFMYAESIH